MWNEKKGDEENCDTLEMGKIHVDILVAREHFIRGWQRSGTAMGDLFYGWILVLGRRGEAKATFAFFKRLFHVSNGRGAGEPSFSV